MDEREQDRHADARLAERLLRGGVGLRHVRRTLRELRDHQADLEERLVTQGHDRNAAACEARQLLGNRDQLAAQMIARPELRSRTRRFAWLVFILGPVPMVLVIGALALLVVGAILVGAGQTLGQHPPSNMELLTVRTLLQWVAPLTVGLLLCRAAARRLLSSVWPLCAMALVAVTSGAIRYFVVTSHGHKPATTLAFGLYPLDMQRIVMLFCVLGLAYLLMRGAQLRRLGNA